MSQKISVKDAIDVIKRYVANKYERSTVDIAP